MTYQDTTHLPPDVQLPPGLAELQNILEAIDTAPVIARLREYRWTGRQGYAPAALLRAFFASYALNLRHTTDLVRRLQDDPQLRIVCGLPNMPHRTTFSRFFGRLAQHQDLLAGCLAELTDRLASKLPDFGGLVAIDSSVVSAYSSRRRKTDKDASWTKKPNERGEDEWHYGYKLHLAADATHGLPIAGYVTTASRNDSPTLPELLQKAAATHLWFRPQHVLADRGYDSAANHQVAQSYGAEAIIPVRQSPGGALKEGIYTTEGVPTCLGGQPMKWVRADPKLGNLYRCPTEGCHLKSRKGVFNCADEVWEGTTGNPRLFGPTRRGGPKWKALYRLRQSVERVFKSLKQSRRLNDHCLQGLAKVGLHALLSVLVFQATALVRLATSDLAYLRWQVRRVA